MFLLLSLIVFVACAPKDKAPDANKDTGGQDAKVNEITVTVSLLNDSNEVQETGKLTFDKNQDFNILSAIKSKLPKGHELKVYGDKDCTKEFDYTNKDKIVDGLEVYLKFKKKSYTLTYNYMVKDSDGNDVVEKFKVLYGDVYPEASFKDLRGEKYEIDGYALDPTSQDYVGTDEIMGDGDITLYVNWHKFKSDYKVVYELQNIDNNEYTFDSEESLIWEIGTSVSPIPEKKEGFETPAIQTEVVHEKDNELVITYRYDRKKFSLNIKPEGFVEGSPSTIESFEIPSEYKNLKYGTKLKVSDILNNFVEEKDQYYKSGLYTNTHYDGEGNFLHLIDKLDKDSTYEIKSNTTLYVHYNRPGFRSSYTLYYHYGTHAPEKIKTDGLEISYDEKIQDLNIIRKGDIKKGSETYVFNENKKIVLVFSDGRANYEVLANDFFRPDNMDELEDNIAEVHVYYKLKTA